MAGRPASAVRMVQAMLASGVDPAVKEDGIWGPRTERAFSRAPSVFQDVISNVVERWNGVSLSSIRPSATSGSAVRSDGFIDAADALRLGVEAERVFHLPPGTMRLLLELEAEPVREGGKVVGYNAHATGGSGGRYLGLYQFYPRERDANGNLYAWGMARAEARRRGVQLDSIESWRDPKQNTIAAAAYAASNSRILSGVTKNVTKELLYAAHQQGVGAVRSGLRSGEIKIVGNQSAASRAVIAQAV